MIKRIIAALTLVVLSVTFFVSCTPKKTEETTVVEAGTYTDFVGKRIGVQIGEIYYTVANDILKTSELLEYPTTTDLLEALRLGKMDAAITDSSYIQPLIDSNAYPEFDYVWVPKEVFANESACVFNNTELKDQFNAWLADIVSDGTMEEIKSRWMGASLPLDEDVPKFESSGENGVLRVCDTGNFPPFTYYDGNGQPTGMDYEVISRFAQHMGMTVEISMMAYDAIGPYVISGKADMSACYLTVTNERGQSMIFGDPIVSTQGVLIVPKGETNASTTSYTYFEGKKIGMKTGSIWDVIIEDYINGIPAFYSEMSAGIEDVRKGRIDGFMTDYSAARIFVATESDGDLISIGVPSEIFSAPMGAVSVNQDMVDRFNIFLAKVKADGIIDEMQKRWLNTVPDLDSPMPDIPLKNTNGTLKIATTAGALPFSYMGANNELKGYSIELIRRFAAHEEMDIEFAEMEFGAMIPYVVSGKADFAIADISITEERKKSVLFTDPTYSDLAGIIAVSPDVVALNQATGTAGGTNKASFIEWMKTGIERNLITDGRWNMIVSGLGVTLTISGLAQIFGTVFGCFVCWLLMRKNKFVNWLARFYCGLIHGTPVVVLLMITYYIIFGSADISNVLVAVAAFTMITGASIAVNLKGSIDTVDTVEIEAARSIGFSSFKAFMAITLPQAIKRALPGYTNGFVELVKTTAIVGYIAIQDLTRAGDIIRSRTYDAYFPLLLVAVIYLIVTTVCVQFFKFIIKRINNKGGEA